MRALLQFVNFLIGGGLIGIGLLLADQPWIEIAQASGTDAFGLIQFHFLLCGAVSLIGATPKKPAIIVYSVSLLFIIGNAVLAWHAVAARDEALLWPAGFLVAGIVNYAWLMVAERASSVERESETETASLQTAPEMGDETLVPPDYAAPSANAYFAGAGRNIFLLALRLILMLGLLYFGAIYLELLRLAIFEQATINLSAVFGRVFGDPAKSGIYKLAIYLVVPLVVYGFVFAIEAAVNIFAVKRNEASAPDLRRDLSREERVFLRDALEQLFDYLDGKSYPVKLRATYIAGVVGVITSFIAVPFGVVMIEDVAAKALEPSRGGGETVYYFGALYFGGAIAGFFAGAFLFWSLYQAMGARNPALAEYLFAEAGWNSAAGQARSPEDMLWVLARHVRRRLIDIKAPFDPAAFIYAAFREREGIIYKAAIYSTVATVVLGVADVARFERVDENGVSFSRYLRFTTERVAVAEIDRVDLMCWLSEPDDDGEVNLILRYNIVEAGAFDFDILPDLKNFEERLSVLEKLDANIEAAGVSVVVAPDAGWLQGDRDPFIPTCADEIRARHEPEIAERLVRLMRAERIGTERRAETGG